MPKHVYKCKECGGESVGLIRYAVEMYNTGEYEDMECDPPGGDWCFDCKDEVDVEEIEVKYKLEADELRDGMWAVRPEGELGTCGFHPAPWQVVYLKAPSADEAIKLAGDSVFNNN